MIFLSLAESAQSEIDLSLTANGFDEYWRLNYTLIAELTRDIAPFSVPRIQGEYLSVFAAASCEGRERVVVGSV